MSAIVKRHKVQRGPKQKTSTRVWAESLAGDRPAKPAPQVAFPAGHFWVSACGASPLGAGGFELDLGVRPGFSQGW